MHPSASALLKQGSGTNLPDIHADKGSGRWQVPCSGVFLLGHDSLNPKTGKKVFACEHSFDDAAKANQSRYPWAQTLVTVGCCGHPRSLWAYLPLAFAFYLRAITVQREPRTVAGEAPVFAAKFAQAVDRIGRVVAVFAEAPVLVIAGIAGSATTVCGAPCARPWVRARSS